MPGILPIYSKEHIAYAIQQMSQKVVDSLNIMQTNKSTENEAYNAAEKEARESFARMLKYYEYSMTTENKSLYDRLTPEAKDKLDKEAKNVEYNKDVNELFDEDNLESTMKIMSADGETARKPDDIIAEMATDHQIRLGTQQQMREQEMHRARLLAGFLDKTGSKSFSGKLKSWFVGNSNEYKEAMRSLKGFADGSVRKDSAIKDIKKYLDIRKSKVRDHQYGRQRFQGFMECLQTMMNPKDFQEYCDEVNQARGVLDKNYDPRHIRPENFAPTAEGSVLKGLLEDEQREQEMRSQREAQEKEAEKQRSAEWDKRREAYEKSVNEEPALEQPGLEVRP